MQKEEVSVLTGMPPVIHSLTSIDARDNLKVLKRSLAEEDPP